MEIVGIVCAAASAAGSTMPRSSGLLRQSCTLALDLHERQGRIGRHFTGHVAGIAFNVARRQDAIDKANMQHFLGADELGGKSISFHP